MVGLVVVDDEVIDFTVFQHRFDFEEIFFQKVGLHGVDKGHFLVDDEVGVVGNAIGQFHVVFKEVGVTVVDTDVVYVFG